MKYILFFLFELMSLLINARQTFNVEDTAIGYKIEVTITPCKNQVVSLGHYYNKNVVWDKTINLDGNCQGVFSDSIKLPGGVYVIYLNDQAQSINLLINEQQHFSITDNLDSGAYHIPVFEQSPENTLFYQHQVFMTGIGKKMQALKEEISYQAKGADPSTHLERFNELQSEASHFEDSIIQLNPNSFFSTMILASRQPGIPGTYGLPPDYHDSATRTYAKAHYWDHVKFSDGRLVYTPFFEDKLDRYFNEILDDKPDSVIKVVDRMLKYARSDSVMNSFLLPKILYASLNHTYGWNDSVFIFIFENYIANNSYDWLAADQKTQMAQKAYYLMGQMIGSVSPEIVLPDLSGAKKSVHHVVSKYLAVCFWDPTCHHCIETLPRLDSIYRAIWKAAGIRVVTVAVESGSTVEDWKQYIHANHFEDWTNLYYSAKEDSSRMVSGKKGYTEEYDVWYYPSFFMMDKDKRFMAKKFTFQQLVDFVSTVLPKKIPVKKHSPIPGANK